MAMIQIRNVPDDVHRALKVRATQAGMTLSEYLGREIAEIASRPTLDEVLARVEGHTSVDLPEPAADLVARERR